MSVHIFTIPFDPQQQEFFDEDLQKFLLNKHVKQIRPEFFSQNGRSYWTVYVESDIVLKEDTSNEAVALDEPQRLLYQRLREWRKEKAQQQGLPVFLVARNRELLDLVQQAPKTVEALRDIRGFGKKKVELYGQEVLGMIRAFYEKTHEKR